MMNTSEELTKPKELSAKAASIYDAYRETTGIKVRAASKYIKPTDKFHLDRIMGIADIIFASINSHLDGADTLSRFELDLDSSGTTWQAVAEVADELQDNQVNAKKIVVVDPEKLPPLGVLKAREFHESKISWIYIQKDIPSDPAILPTIKLVGPDIVHTRTTPPPAPPIPAS